MTSKGQVTVPKAVRDALGLDEGDTVAFRVEGQRAMLARIPDLLDLAGASDLIYVDLIVAETLYVLESYYDVPRIEPGARPT
ncbi:MAG: AbrB/MazE/SpoVT family DNA-binding domain-containing protein [Acidimicrobiia bacterium]|nr:AbrB/MazE/SpoVT family DNA-binding domain-containing protein [Acidimicrobiia bacterium]